MLDLIVLLFQNSYLLRRKSQFHSRFGLTNAIHSYHGKKGICDYRQCVSENIKLSSPGSNTKVAVELDYTKFIYSEGCETYVIGC